MVVEIPAIADDCVPRRASNSAVTSFVVVLPALPVIATTFVARRSSESRVPERCSADGRVVDLDRPRPARPSSRVQVRRRANPRGTTIPPRLLDARRRSELSPVEPFAANRDEEVVRRERPRIDRHAAEFRATRRRPPRPAHRRQRCIAVGDSHAGGKLRTSDCHTHARVRPTPRQRLARHRDVVERQHCDRR